MSQTIILLIVGILAGLGASFSGLGGGFMIIPILLCLGYQAQKAVGTTFLAILIISISALFAHNRLANVDYRTGLILGVGGVMGAQVGARLLMEVSTSGFKKIFAIIMAGLAVYMFIDKT